MALSVKPAVYQLPSYSLTGDLIGFLRCGLQYRYTRLGRLPSSHPLQLWFGEFIHGVLEEAYRRYKDSVVAGSPDLPPWVDDELAEISDLIKARLSARNLVAWDPNLESLGDARARAAIQDLGPHLFPLIHRAEVRLTGARALPKIASTLQFREADRYEMVGVVDVVTHLELTDPTFKKNPIVLNIAGALTTKPAGPFEVIIDYKGMRRPPVIIGGAGLWAQYEWQLLTYAELRRKQADALPVAAGVLLYVNELFPTSSDLALLKREIKLKRTDLVPTPGSEDEKALNAWSPRGGGDLPELSLEYRLQRALRVIPVSQPAIQNAVKSFDKIVERIETCRGKEFHGSGLLTAWERNSSDESTCAVCDSRTFCPDFQKHYATKLRETKPRLPGVPHR